MIHRFIILYMILIKLSVDWEVNLKGLVTEIFTILYICKVYDK